ncbi:MAG: ABC transporter ATP-binding protein [Candidatus Omnitrophica bacterium]|nr:ABC transporter ATP-binding protein [Candidatus Omnitrophota bacterium]
MKLKLVSLTKKFTSLRGSVRAVDGIDLEIQDNEFFVLLGPSGCGKSTVLNLIAGLEKPTGGEIWFDDRVVACAKKKIFFTPKERNVAFVFQSYALYPHLSVFENIAFPLRIIGEDVTKIKESVKRVGAMLEISNLFSARPCELSGGQRQRVAIARAIVRYPNVFLLDEPLSNLDAQLRVSTRDELKRLQQRLGVTTIYVTHDQVEAMTLGDRIALLKDGRVEQIGTPDQLYECPASEFAAKFIGSPPMNIFEAEVSEEGEEFYIIIGGEKIKMPDDKAEELKRLKGRSCAFGIRPEDIHIPAPILRAWKSKRSQYLKAKIDLIEPMGRERFFHITINEHRFSLLTTDVRFKQGEVVDVEFDLKKLHIFEKK